MVVDDSAVIRGLLTKTLETDPNIRVVMSASDGIRALENLRRQAVDVVILDIEMPRMDGMQALPEIISLCPGIKVVMASTLTTRNADIAMRALEAGAADYVPKPTTNSGIMSGEAFKRELIGKVLAYGGARRRRRLAGAPAVPSQTTSAATTPARPSIRRPAAGTSAPIVLRRPMQTRPRVLAIGSSTGGPQALFTLLKDLSGLSQPIVLTQHMPEHFTQILAQHIQRNCGLTAAEAQDGEVLAGGRLYLAPGGRHLTVVQGGAGRAVVKLTDGPPENFCRPAVDPMLRSLVQVFGGDVLTVMLTGMGHDGLAGCREVVAKGGGVIAQDEASSVVWGMPGAVAQAGLCSAVLPLNDISKAVLQHVGRSPAAPVEAVS